MIRNLIESEIRKAVKKLFAIEISFDVSPSDRYGDYASNAAMVLAKELGQDPCEVAEKIITEIQLGHRMAKLVSQIEVARPGFLNFYLSKEFFVDEIKKILEKGDDYGKNNDLKNKKVMVEYTDPNPFKEFHIGHLMSNSIGEAISRIIEASGAKIKRVNYQGDVGMHVAKAIWGMKKLNLAKFDSADLGKAYAKGATAYQEDRQAKQEISKINKKIYERSDEEINKLYDKGKKTSLEQFETIYKKLGTKFDKYFFESEMWKIGKKIVEDGLRNDVFKKSKGAIIFKGEEYGLHTRVFITADGIPTYEAKELGLAKTKFEKHNPDISISVTGDDITEYFKVVKKAIELINPDWSRPMKHLPHGTLRLPSGKMSSRTGDVITAEELIKKVSGSVSKKMEDKSIEEIERVAIAAIKYFILKQSTKKDVIFDFDKSISFEGNSGPYLQYTHARANSILEKAKKEGVTLNLGAEHPSESGLEKLLIRFPETVEEANKEYAPHYICTYLIELAQAFNSYYAKSKIVDENDETSPYKVALTKAVQQVLKNGLNLLAIHAPERM